MATTITAQPNQTMPDMIVQGCGSLEAGWQFCQDNGVAISDIPVVGTKYLVSDAALALGNATALSYFQKNGIVIGNLAGSVPIEIYVDGGGDAYADGGGSGYVPE